MIDIPIGLPESARSSYRACDLAAREKLGSARSRVFLGVRRPLLDFCSDYSKANAWAKADGKGLSRQCFCILPKIAEVDRFVTPEHQNSFLRETHPELIFHRLNSDVSLPGKKTAAGRAERVALLERHGFEELAKWLALLPRRKAGADDLLDACACAIAARDAADGRKRRLVCPEERDSRGLRMEMWY